MSTAAMHELVRSYPLTSLQSGMLFHEVREICGVDIEQIVCRTGERIELEPFTRALATLVERHPVLRTRFVWDTDDAPYQEIDDTALPEVRLLERTLLPEAERVRNFQGFLFADRSEGIPLSRAPLIRASVLRYGDDDTRVVLSLHHAIVDGRCFPILLDDLFACYDAYRRGLAPAAAVPRLAFREFVEWSAAQDHETRSRTFWQDRLRGFTAPTPLVVDDLPDVDPGQLSWQEELSCSAGETRALEALAMRANVTVHTLVQAAWALLLSRYASETDVVFGGTRACRKSSIPGVDDAVGLFINTLPVRAQVDPDKPLFQFLQELRQQWMEMRAHEHTPLSRVQGWSDLEKGQSLFSSILVFETFDLGETMRSRGGAWAHREVELYERTNFPITVAAYHGAERLRIKIEFDQARFSIDTVRRMLGHLHALLQQFTAMQDSQLSAFQLTTALERRELHATWATAQTFPVPGTLVAWFAAQAARTPDRLAVSCGTRQWTYRELDAAANRVAQALVRRQDVTRGDIVGLCVERSADIIIGILGILKTGAAYMPIDLAYPADRLKWMLQDATSRVLLTQQALVGQLPETTAVVVTFEGIASDTTLPATAIAVETDLDDLAYVIFTSGSTGKPKGCRVTHRNVARLMTATEALYHFDEHDVWTLFHSFAFDFSVWEIWGALLYGGRVVVVPFDVTRSPDDFLVLLADECVTVLNQTPSAFRQLIAAEARRVGPPVTLALRYVIFGGEALELASLRPWFVRHGDVRPQLINMYGITETTVHVTYRPISMADISGGSVIGRQLPDLEIHLLDPAGHAVPIGVPGEIFVGGAGVAAGYLNRPDLTASRFVPHPLRRGEVVYRTGDIARFLPTADLEYLGRIDDQVKIRGFRIELGEIQAVLLRHPAVREALVTVHGTGAEKRIVAYLVGDRIAGSVKALRDFAGVSMPPYMIPSAFVYVDRFPLTTNGKIDRKALPDPEDAVRVLSGHHAPPLGATETALGEIWARVLQVDRVGRDEDYFELGGDSILSIQIVSQARRAGIRLTPRDLFERRTIQELAAVADTRTNDVVPSAPALTGAAPLTPIQRWFFRHDLPDANHWTQSFLFDLRAVLDTEGLQRALRDLVRHHDALRTAFRDGVQEVQPDVAYAFRQVDGPLLDDAMPAICAEAQRALCVASGRLLSAVYFPSRAQLYLAIHHLAVDGVSWRIVLEDLEHFLLGKPVDAVPTPFVNWAHHVASLASDTTLQAQRAYWEQQARLFRLQPDRERQVTTVGDAQSITVRLSLRETEQLAAAATAMRAQVDEVLVAGVVHALAAQLGVSDVALDLEGHGRREASVLDVSRTVGWFTTMYPLALRVNPTASLVSAVATTKRAMRDVPERGFGFGLLDVPDPGRDVLFNYLGRFDRVTSDSTLFAFASQDSGSWYDAGSSRSHQLEINCWIKSGCLEFTWTFAALPRELVATMAERCAASLRQLSVDDAGASAWIAADFPLAALRDVDVAQLQGDVEDVLPLTSMQELYYSMELARPGSAIDQWHWALTGPVDAAAVRAAFESALAQHAGLRTEFHGAGFRHPVQVVRPRMAIPMDVVQAADTAAFEDILRADRARGMRVDQAPLMRLTLVEMPDAPTRLIWTHHHLQVDGWSWPVLLAHVSAAYRALTRGEPLALSRGASIREYLAWSRSQDLNGSRAFWQRSLQGFTRPTPVASGTRGHGAFHERSHTVDGDTGTRLHALARRWKCPLNALVQAAWAVVLSRQADQRDVVFGATFSGRPAEVQGVESMIGAFVNNLPVRASIRGDQTFKDLARDLHAQAITLDEHQHLPLREIQELSEVPLRSPLFESLLVFQNYTIDEQALRWTETVRVQDFVAPVRTNYPLTLVVRPDRSALHLDLIYQGGRVDDATAARLLGAMGAMLSLVVETPDVSIERCTAAVDLPTLVMTTVAPVRGATSSLPTTALQKQIAVVWERAFGLSDIGIDENFFDLGGHSLLLIRVHALLCRELARDLSVVDVFGNPTIRKLAAALQPAPDTMSPPVGARAARALPKAQDIAIVGMSGRFPGAESVQAFWQNLLDNVESIVTFTDDELRLEGLDAAAMRAAGHYVQRRGQLPDPDQFDAAFFGMSPNEAAATDPQQRLFLETAWSALEDAGYAPSRIEGRVGVFAGMSNNTFYEQYVQGDTRLRSQLGDLVVMMGNEKDYLATRTAYKLNLNGPALNIYTACSTSLVAVAEAVYALREGRCDMAIAGAVSITFPQNRGYYHEDGGITSPDGHCRPFDANAGGTVFSNGLAAIVLKPLEQALADGDTIHAVVKGVGVNNDGSDKVSFTAPSVAGQSGAIRDAYEQSGVSPDTVGYVEAHGTATALGDPIEFEALTVAFREKTTRVQHVGLGSVKSNVGHLDAAAGMAGLIKTALMVKHGVIPATLHFSRAHPALRIEQSPFRVVATNEVWTTHHGAPRRAGVSSFGVGGTNTHVVLEQPPVPVASSPSQRTAELLVLSARSAVALDRMRAALADHLESHPDISLADVAFTLATGREVFAHRLAIPVDSVASAIGKLRSPDIQPQTTRRSDLPVAFLFPGQGAQFAGMGRRWYATEPVFREAVDTCAALLQPLIGTDIRSVMFTETEEATQLLNRTRFTQPALFVTSYALAQVWKRYGVSPSAMIGHSVGEYSAACLAGAIPLDLALRLIATRGRLVDALPGGAMLSIRLPAAEVTPWLTGEIAIAAINSPVMTVIAGPSPAVAALAERLVAADIPHRDLRTSHAFHSAMMDPVVAPFRDAVADVSFAAPQVPYVSNVTGTWVTAAEVASPDYWADHVRQTVRFEDGIRCLVAETTSVLVEVGPGRSGVTFARQSIPDGAQYPIVTSLPKEDDRDAFAGVVGALWAAGGRIDWSEFFRGEQRRRVSLPTYPFEHKRHWPSARTLSLPLAARQMAATQTAPSETTMIMNSTIAASSSDATPVLVAPPTVAPPTQSRKERLVADLREQIHQLTGFDDIVDQSTFLDLGLDSLLIGQAATTLSRHYGTRITFKHLMDDHDSVLKLAGYLDGVLDPSKFAEIAPAPMSMHGDGPMIAPTPSRAGSLDDRVARLEAMLQQLVPAPSSPPPLAASAAVTTTRRYEAGQLHKAGNAPISFGPFRRVATDATDAHALTARQRAHLSALIHAYTARTPKSKASIAASRTMLADPRAGAGFNRLWKEMVYPVVTTGSKGAHLWDLDGNQWVDVTLGFGLGLFGHRPDFVERAVAEQLRTGFEIGPSTPLAGEVAAMLCAVSGKDRATFCDTGSEAVTAAIRVARTVSQRDTIAIFQGSYHGIFDEVLGRAVVRNGQLTTVPIAPGITADSLANVLVLEYGNPESLAFIKRYAGELAAVLVEPVQSRRPDLQPREFLHELRALTAAHDIALIFDEVVTGFRCHPRGAQGVFGVDADLVTYGKVMGGGMPIGALAGRKKYMDALDGGAWNYGDDSGPDASVTFFAGTFVRHPLVLAAARAVLTELDARGPSLQEELDGRTASLVDAMNACAEEAGVPVKVTRFSSMFMVNFAPGLKYASLFFYHMRLRGVHIWETRPSFLSVAHSDDDVAQVLSAFRESLTALQEGGFLPGGPDEDLVPVTPEQGEVLVASAMSEAHSRAFNESISIRFEGTLDRRALDTVVRAVVARHESLRAVFERDGSAQRFVPAARCGIRIVDADLRTASNAEIAAFRDTQMTALFDLHEGPLCRFVLLSFGEARHELLVVAHHAVCDGWSFGVVYDDLQAHYRCAIGDTVPLPAATPFRASVDRQQLPEIVAQRAEDTAHWVAQLASNPPTLALPGDLQVADDAFACRSSTRTLPESLCQRIAEFCKAQRVTPYMLFFAAYRDVLARLSAQESFCIGTPVASQASAGLPGLVGHGVHFLPLPCVTTPEISIREYLAANRAVILDSLDHQSTTLSRILRDLPDGRRLSRVAATFSLEATSPTWTGADVSVSLQVNAKKYSTFDLSLFAMDDHGRFSFLVLAASGRFSASLIESWTDMLIAWLDAVMQAPDTRRVADLLIASPVAALPTPTVLSDVVSLFEEQVQRTPAAVALRGDGRALSYAETNALANAAAHRLAADGVAPGSRVILEAERSMEFVLAVLAILKCGAAYVPIDPTYPDAHKRHQREDATAVCTLNDAALTALFSALEPQSTAPAGRSDLTAESLAYVMFTSGSTGRPKGVLVPHRGIARLVRQPGCIDVVAHDVFLLASPLSFDASTLEIWGALLNGACLAIPAPGTRTIRELAESLTRYQVSVMWLTAGLFHAMVDECPEALSSLRVLMAGGDVLSPSHVAKALTRLPHTRLVNGYGPTENTTFTTTHEISPSDLQRSSIPIGRPIPGTTVLILDGEGRPVPNGIAGELYVGGAGVALGYAERPELTASSFVTVAAAGPAGGRHYRTGDRCRVLPDGSLEFLGRLDQQVKLRGFRVEPAEIEAVLLQQLGVSSARVLVHEDAVAGKSLVAFCVGDPSRATAVFDAIRQALPRHMHPQSLEFVPALPLSPTGKVDTRALLERVGRKTPPAGAAVAVEVPVTATEQAVYAIWAELLGRAHFSVSDTFFDLGGHSLLGLRMFNRLETTFGFISPLAVLFQHPTVRALAGEIDRRTSGLGRPATLEPDTTADDYFAILRNDGRDAPLFLIHGGDGGVMFYQALVSKMVGIDCPVYALESPSLNRRDLHVPDFDTLVTDYLEMIRRKQPTGPYRIGGYSFGGIVAFEIAARMHAMGLDVKLVIFDSANPVTTLANRHAFARRLHVAWTRYRSDTLVIRCGKILGRMASRRSDERTLKEREQRCRAAWNSGTLTSLEDRAFYLNVLHQELLANYVPTQRVSDALLVTSSVDIEGCDLPPDYGWGEWVEHLDTLQVPADHFTVFSPPAVDTMVPVLQGYLSA